MNHKILKILIIVFNFFQILIITFSKGGRFVSEQDKAAAWAFMQETKSSPEEFHIPRRTYKQLKKVINWCKESTDVRPETVGTSAASRSTGRDTSQAIQARIAKASANLTVNFNSKFLDILFSQRINIDSNFLATCPKCHKCYSVLKDSRGTFDTRNCLRHFENRHTDQLNLKNRNNGVGNIGGGSNEGGNDGGASNGGANNGIGNDGDGHNGGGNDSDGNDSDANIGGGSKTEQLEMSVGIIPRSVSQHLWMRAQSQVLTTPV